MKQKLLALVVLLICGVSAAKAQKISVEAFNRIDRDMGARVAKVRDINSDLCALIKIETIETGFEFSGCIIEKTEQKTGEIWVFVSPGVKFLTIKHKDFGVLRNYNFPQSIESGVVYQMKLRTVAKPKIDSTMIQNMQAQMEALNKKLAELENKQKQDSAASVANNKKARKPRPKPILDGAKFIMANAAYSVAPQTSVGITYGQYGVGKRFGWHITAASGFDFKALNPKYSDAEPSSQYFYDGERSFSRLALNAGMLYRVSNKLALKLGIGYGIRNVAFSTLDGDYAKIANASYSGLEAAVGIHLSFGKMAFDIDMGGIGTDFKYSEIRLGVGYNFGIKKQQTTKEDNI
mgnify:CR=1 FL=1